MKQLVSLIPVLSILFLAACSGETRPQHSSPSFAIYAEYAHDSNKLMKADLNRRVFDTVEAQYGNDIALIKTGSDAGCITLEKGTYRITGFSMVTMQDSLSLPHMDYNDTYPGYALVYPELYEDSTMNPLLKHAISIGCLSIPYFSTTSQFDCVYTAKEKIKIAVGHQSGHNLHNEVYLSIYEVAGLATDYHVVARIAITKIEEGK